MEKRCQENKSPLLLKKRAFGLVIAACGIRQAKVLCPDGNNVVCCFAETLAANNGRFTHLDRSKGGFDHLATHAALLLGFARHRHFAPPNLLKENLAQGTAGIPLSSNASRTPLCNGNIHTRLENGSTRQPRPCARLAPRSTDSLERQGASLQWPHECFPMLLLRFRLATSNPEARDSQRQNPRRKE